MGEKLSAQQRSKIRRLSQPKELAPDEEGGELNIVPFLDIITNVLMFVLATVTVTFTATSAEFDAYLFLYDPSGNIIQEDDDGAGGLNARISRSLTAAWYVIEVSSSFEGEVGNYTLTVN